ncbi:head maturation protease, ClpP-related [Telmatobacter bradus]|uniref:head maturation protease, ClpP-related n=1 Tax=Telmatobacter bradus TaxID=474953 RepID=UPI003B43B8C5
MRKPVFKAAVQGDGTLELLVYEEIGENYWSGGGVTAKTVKQQIDQAGPHTAISVRINSPGGDAFEGIAIHNLLRAQGKPVNVCIDGIAASAASVIAMAGDTRVMGNSAMMMIHNAWSTCQGYADDMRKTADTLDRVSASVAQTYMDRAGLSEDKAHELMDAESWLSAKDCVDLNLATAVADLEDEDSAMALARGFKSLRHLKNLPSALRNQAQGDDCQCYCAPCQDGRCNECECRGCDADNCDANNCNCHGAASNSVEPPPAAKTSSDLSMFEAELQMIEQNL